MHFSQFCFHMFNFVSRGSSECFIFKWLARKNFKRKNFFCAARMYGMSLLHKDKEKSNYAFLKQHEMKILDSKFFTGY